MNPDFKDYLLKVTQSSACKEVEAIQSLWSGYGKITRYRLQGAPYKTVVVKSILLSPQGTHPRGWNTNNSHNRKVKSYQVETNWYEKWNHLCSDKCRTPEFIGSFSQGDNQWIILEDLDTNFPLRKSELNLKEVKVCLEWLANFHSIFLSKKPVGLWEVGTYWHLATRPDELEKIENQELKAKAPVIDALLNQCQHQTLVHGDAKLANFCFSESGEKVAAVDFQYVGGGCGIKDVAYFLGSCLTSSDLEYYERELLDFYFSELKMAIETSIPFVNFSELEKEWRKLYPIACTDFTRFLLGWMPTHQKLNDYNLKIMNSVLVQV
jgi:hypothetical protein